MGDKRGVSLRSTRVGRRFKSIELCAGAGGMALGLEQAGFDPLVLIENLGIACTTLRTNRPKWSVLQADLLTLDLRTHLDAGDGVDLLAAGLPRVRSAATVSRPRGDGSELALLETTGRLVSELLPRALLVENVPDLVLKSDYAESRSYVEKYLIRAGYDYRWLVIDASNFGVPQHRLLGLLVAFRDRGMEVFEINLPTAPPSSNLTVGSVLRASMGSRGWAEADVWATYADDLAPTIVGGSWDRGGADLGPSGSQRAWARLGIEGKSLWDEPPSCDFRFQPDVANGRVRLTVDQVAILQGFPVYWQLCGRKTAQYRQVGNATPPPVARAIGQALMSALKH